MTSAKMLLDVILNGPLPHDFIVTYDGELNIATYYGQRDIVTSRSLSRSGGIHNRKVQFMVKSGFRFLGAGTAR